MNHFLRRPDIERAGADRDNGQFRNLQDGADHIPEGRRRIDDGMPITPCEFTNTPGQIGLWMVDDVKGIALIDSFPVHDAPLFVRVDQQDPFSLLRQCVGQVDGDGRFTHPPFLIDQTDNHK